MKQTIIRLNIEDEKRCIEYELISGKGVKYRITNDYCLQTHILPSKQIDLALATLYLDGMLHIKAGYEWNGPNIVLDTDSIMRASLVHDVFCEFYACGLLTKCYIPMFNNMFETLSREDGATKFRAKLHRLGLKIGWKF